MKKARNEVAVGAFVVIGLTLLALLMFFISGVYLFRAGYTVNVVYDYVDILDKGAPIRMAGVRVGEVQEINLFFDPNLKRTRVNVKLFIEQTANIRENYKFEIRGTHVLSEPHIEISPVPGDAAPMKEGAVVEGEKLEAIEELIKRAQRISLNLDEMVSGLRDAFKDDPNSQSMKDLVRNLSTLSASLAKLSEASEGDLQQTFANIRVSSDSMKKILSDMEQGKGTVGALMVNDEIYKDMRDLVSDVKKHPWKLLKKK